MIEATSCHARKIHDMLFVQVRKGISETINLKATEISEEL